jgi:murein DD-endopeptidase MepM/ murein hydrolase activator NlpD
MEIRMQTNSLLTAVMIVLLVSPAKVLAESGARWLNDGKPVQARVFEPARDRNHEPANLQRSALERSAERDEQGKPQASTEGFQIPLRRGLSNTSPGLITIAAYVDHDQVNPDSLLDWNCGERTYDGQDFGHNGTDFNGVLYPWRTMANDGMIVTAAADGEIVDRNDGEFDQNCAFDAEAESNTVILKHADGKITIYAHMKKGTVTPRKVGDQVEQGDYLGVMGSSGMSTGPHLHMGVQDFSNNLFDPYVGTCNELNAESLWEDQEDYKEQTILAAETHSAAPEYPPCPEQEKPNLKEVFAAADTVFASATVRDFDNTDEFGVEVLDPSGQVILATTYSNTTPGHFAGIQIYWNFQLPQPAIDGEYTWRISYGGNTLDHSFYVGAGPDPAPEAMPANNAFTGLWYDPAFDGEGFNIVTTDGGTIVYFYGSDDRGNRLWLISDLIPGEIKTGVPITVSMYESTGGIFPTPVPSARGLSQWGTLSLLFSACNAGQSTLSGIDGSKNSQITKLAGVAGAACVEGDVPADAPWAGLWYDSSKDGEGYNLIVAPIGRILYFYGFKTGGLRLWLVSGLIADILGVGQTVTIKMYESTEGTFDSPVPSGDALVEWGTAEITVIDCNTVTIVLTGADGNKTSNTVRLAGIIGSTCPL